MEGESGAPQKNGKVRLVNTTRASRKSIADYYVYSYIICIRCMDDRLSRALLCGVYVIVSDIRCAYIQHSSYLVYRIPDGSSDREEKRECVYVSILPVFSLLLLASSCWQLRL